MIRFSLEKSCHSEVLQTIKHLFIRYMIAIFRDNKPSDPLCSNIRT